MTEQQQMIINYHKKNPHLYKAFKQYSSNAFGSGYKYFSAELIINRMRWHSMIEAKDDSFKIRNDIKPFFARMLMANNKKYNNFFKLRSSIWDDFNFNEL